MAGSASAIRTPDQRLRVFVSSTLKELQPERRVIRSAIERLALAPVMFELGARPHPPRSLYRAYLEQSDIFVGIYWESYGWMAPGEQVSGLEDEYNLAPDIPMLIYVKRSEQRQGRLERLLERIRSDDRASYVEFENADDLAPLLTSDLATLLAERFDGSGPPHGNEAGGESENDAAGWVGLPNPLTSLIGRDTEVQRVVDLLTTQGRRLVTITGPGGIGKSRLAIAAARQLLPSFPDGVAFVDLAPVRDSNLLLSSIALALGISGGGPSPLMTTLTRALEGRRVLLLLDNVEQVADAAPELSMLLNDSGASMLTTSRVLLHIAGEQSVPLAPLPTPAAIDLFVDRARALKPDFELTEANAGDVAAVVAAVDNVPLALELAAARLQVLTPRVLATRLDHALPLLVGGARDRPERQRTLRATIEWSVQLLSGAERDLFTALALFRNGFPLDAAEWMSVDGDADTATDLLTALVESSLVQVRDRDETSWFSMLAAVREFAREKLEQRADVEDSRQRHAEYFSALTRRAESHLTGADQNEWIARLRSEIDDLRAAIEHYLSTGQPEGAAAVVWPAYWFWWTTGRVGEAAGWMRRLETAGPLSERTRYRSRLYILAPTVLDNPDPGRIPELQDCVEFFLRDTDRFAEFLARVAVATLEMARGPEGFPSAEHHLQRAELLAVELSSDFLAAMALLIGAQLPLARGDMAAAIAKYEASLDAAKAGGERLSESAALYGLGWAHLLQDDKAAATDYFAQQMRISRAVDHEQGIANGLDGMVAVAVAAGDFHRAGRLAGTAEELRRRRGLLGTAMPPFYARVLAAVDTAPARQEFASGREQGRRADLTQVVDDLLSPLPEVDGAVPSRPAAYGRNARR